MMKIAAIAALLSVFAAGRALACIPGIPPWQSGYAAHEAEQAANASGRTAPRADRVATDRERRH